MLDNKIEDYRKRGAFLESKYPNMDEAPKSVQEEVSALVTLLNYTRYNSEEKLTGSLKENYEDALERYRNAQEDNKNIIDPEEENLFEVPKVDFEELNEEFGDVRTEGDATEFLKKLISVQSQRWLSNEEIIKLDELEYDLAKKSNDIKMIKKSEVAVKKSSFEKIYNKARAVPGKLKEAFNRFKSFLKGEREEEREEDNIK